LEKLAEMTGDSQQKAILHRQSEEAQSQVLRISSHAKENTEKPERE
jgi:hypothetical protein